MTRPIALTLVALGLELAPVRPVKGQSLPVARGRSVIGDRWTLLILQDCFQGGRRFDRFQQRPGRTRYILADRLRNLEDAGVLRRE